MPSTSGSSPLIRLHINDNVQIARAAIELGQACDSHGLTARDAVPAGHKVAVQGIAAGDPIRKYDTVIGLAARDIEAGEHVHTHNTALADIDVDPAFGADVRPVDYVPHEERATFMGIVRPAAGSQRATSSASCRR